VRRGWIDEAPGLSVTVAGQAHFAGLGIDVPALERGRRPVCRPCLDWSERRSHLAGSLGAALLEHVVGRRWARRELGRVVVFTPAGSEAFGAVFGLAGG
jgi:hypothetical protein